MCVLVCVCVCVCVCVFVFVCHLFTRRELASLLGSISCTKNINKVACFVLERLCNAGVQEYRILV